jgi:hypothetical protein
MKYGSPQHCQETQQPLPDRTEKKIRKNHTKQNSDINKMESGHKLTRPQQTRFVVGPKKRSSVPKVNPWWFARRGKLQEITCDT